MGRIEKTVFVSYRRADESWGLAIFQELTQHGYDVFIDYDGIASGNFEAVILENIRARAHFLVLLTPTALERCGDPKDWMRREIEAALDSQRNIVPLMLAGFDFGKPAIASQLVGKLAALKNYNGIEIPKARFFSSEMGRLRNKFLNVEVDAVLHPASDSAQQIAKEQKDKATMALGDEQRKPRDQPPSQLPETQTTTFTHWLGHVIECIKDFYRPLEDLRIIVISLLAGGFALLYLDQGRDVIRGLVDSANAVMSNWPPKGEILREVLPIIWRWVAFMLACAWSGINAWYWANLLYKTGDKGDQQQPRWFLFARRGFGVLPLLAAVVAMPLSARHGISDTWFGMLCFAAAAGLLLWFFAYRTTWFTAENAPKTYKEVDRGKNLVQGDIWFVRTTIAVSLLTFVLLLIPRWRTEFAWIVGPAALAYGAIGCIIPITSYLISKTRSQNIPVIMLGGLAFVLFSLANDNHRVRALDVAMDSAKRPGVEDALRRWEKDRKPDEPLILVATAGGASRAAYWTGTVLRALDNRSNGQFSDHVFAISSVSGGALGAIGYAAWLADRPMESEAQPDAANARLNFVQTFFGQDYLGPAVGALLFPDMIQRFLPAPLLPDRAASLEEAFELGWEQSAKQCKQEPCPKPTRFADEYTQIWSKSRLHEDAVRWVPIVLANGTHVESGKRIITAPVKIEPSVFEDTYDFYKLAPAPIRASTAVLNSARFTVVSPPGRLVDGDKITGRIIDGGYFENGGMETVYDLARYLRRTMRPQRPIIVVEILNDDTMGNDDLARHDGTAPVLVEDPKSQSRSPLLLEVTSVIGGLYHTRSARGVLGAKRISDESASGLGDAKFYSFDLRPLNRNWYTAMSWALSQGTRDAMDVAINTTKDQIEHFLDRRNYAPSMRRTLTDDLLTAAANLNENNSQLDAVLNELKANVKVQGEDPVIPAKRK